MEFEKIISPNQDNRPPDTSITMIVMHATANSTLDGLTSWFMNPAAKVSAHYGIGKDGKIIQYVEDGRRAWHAGSSYWKGRDSCNNFSIGIELVNLNDGVDRYPVEQIESSIILAVRLINTYPIDIHDIVAHYDISPGRKSDPKGFYMERFRHELSISVFG